jgi:tRNA 5-methylaminomethyl-2-thiouridine biosynthesis bifunctional protein
VPPLFSIGKVRPPSRRGRSPDAYPIVNDMTFEPLERDASGAPFSTRYGDIYASRDGALAEKSHVFLHGNGLPARWGGRSQFVVLETGFGLGLNFLLTWHAWRDDPQRPRRLHFVSIEAHPLHADDLLAFAPAPLRPLAQQLATQWPLPLPGLHRLEFERGAVVLTLAVGDVRRMAGQLVLGADAFYLDGFAPSRNPQMWDAAVLKALARSARAGATVASYTAARPVRDALGAAGFDLSLVPGFGRKRQMLTGRYAPRWKTRRHDPPMPYDGDRSAVVVGGGLAGCNTAAALVRRGWQVQMVEREPGPARGASALPAGLLHPLLAADDSHLSRLTRSGFMASVRSLNGLRAGPGVAADWCGVLQQARDSPEEALWRRLAMRAGWPPQWAQWCEADDAAQRIGVAPARGGWWFPSAGVVRPAAWCQALLDEAGEGIDAHWRTEVTGLSRAAEGRWHARYRGADGEGTLQAAAAVLANAAGASTLLALDAPLQAVRGRVSAIAEPSLAGLRAALSGDGYLLPLGRTPGSAAGIDPGLRLVGASYELGLPASVSGNADGRMEPAVDLPAELVHRGNLQRLGRLLRNAPPEAIAAVYLFDGWRCVSADRLPLVGAPIACQAFDPAAAARHGAHLADLPRQAGLQVNCAFGSRGLTWAALAADLLASRLEGEPLPLEKDLADAVDPARFALQRLRRGRTMAGGPG